MGIERFFIIANRGKDKDQEFSYRIRRFIEEQGRICEIAYTKVERARLRADLRSGTDCVIVLGGDGTMLEAAYLAAGTGTPLLGINIGTLGYLVEVEGSCWESALLRVLHNEYELESRMMLEARITDSEGNIYEDSSGQALNEIVVTGNRGMHMLDCNVYIDGQFLNRYSGDGIILSTATGSTGYSMSAGGPIVEPKARLILLTPINPHTLNNRSIVLSADDQIMIEIPSPRGGGPLYAECDFDGSGHFPLKSGDRIHIFCSPWTTSLIRLSEISFLETLQRKITT